MTPFFFLLLSRLLPFGNGDIDCLSSKDGHIGSRGSRTQPIDSSWSQLSVRPSEHPAQPPGPSVGTRHPRPRGRVFRGRDRRKSGSWVWGVGVWGLGGGGLPQPGQPAAGSPASEGRRSHVRKTPRSPRKSCQERGKNRLKPKNNKKSR